eukprot:CAMPEP_0114353278 /NCGR_PEP_ID=MMETSP0101-20121206/18545_1 /TAXON_ID=38822 ORGANISM="Pteridomonas danica, Strain PT" /NCGR_SAMPLE_ID=MMETSP0101 /ASSEMBLY_ACC=CAM_ASM_000211 /LENGTH=89 /DNA_ID=CAMNT_0001494037 /DNA_START=590 /DNA_END=855 /DNA_ORIENTATION=+
MDAGIGGEVGTVIIVAGGVYAAHRSGMSPFQIMMMLNMLNRGGGETKRSKNVVKEEGIYREDDFLLRNPRQGICGQSLFVSLMAPKATA